MQSKNILHYIFIAILFIAGTESTAQTNKPKLVVGVVIDQMRYEYLHRFADHYGETGFKRLIREGFSLKNVHYNYIPTKTAPGHSSIYSGTTPAVHGIIGNNWYDRTTKKEVYCVTDRSEKTIGSASTRGQASPRKMITSTVTDELRLSNQMQSKVISISIKDRGAVLPGGHTANGAYWYDIETGDFISSSYYMNELPEWATNYNQKKEAQKYMNSTWATKFPIKEYTMSRVDNYSAEGKLLNEETPSFPHDLSKLTADKVKKYEVVKYTPFANTMTTDFTIEALNNELLGKGEFTDFLTVSYSATDYIGHKFGPNSVELEDTYLRLDDEISRLLESLDKSIGKGNYTLFLTADHAALDIPAYLKEKKIPSGSFNSRTLVANLNNYLSKKYGEGSYVERCMNLQLYFNWKEVSSKKINTQEFFQKCYQFIMTQPGVMQAYSANSMLNGDFNEGGVKGTLIRGFNHRRSGEIMIVLEPNWFDDLWGDAADHGSGFTYDTHVPLIFFGSGIKQGSTVKYHPITDIAPTISTLLNIKFPNGTTGNPIVELLDE
jgi:predicted AlkP superfamily pyrophosphatase or phosphodiesterase